MDLLVLYSVWSIQFILYVPLTFRWIRLPIKKRDVLIVSVIIFFIAPWMFPVQGGYDAESDRYVCGLATLIPFMVFWFIGNGVSLLMIVFIHGVGAILDNLRLSSRSR